MIKRKRRESARKHLVVGHNYGVCKSNYQIGVLVTDYDGTRGLAVSNRKVPD